jgi:hypothetical protein
VIQANVDEWQKAGEPPAARRGVVARAARGTDLAALDNRKLQAELHRRAALSALDFDDVAAGLSKARLSVTLARRAADPCLEGRCRTALVRALAFGGRLRQALREVEEAARLL